MQCFFFDPILRFLYSFQRFLIVLYAVYVGNSEDGRRDECFEGVPNEECLVQVHGREDTHRHIRCYRTQGLQIRRGHYSTGYVLSPPLIYDHLETVRSS